MFNEIIQGRAMASGSKGAIESLKSARRLRDMIHQTFHIKHIKDFINRPLNTSRQPLIKKARFSVKTSLLNVLDADYLRKPSLATIAR